jgi:TPR repeat protein
MSRHIFILIIFMTIFLNLSTSNANYDSSLKAYKNNKWELAISECKKLIYNDKCLNLLGIMHLNGYGVIKNSEKAHNYFLQAEKLGNNSAKFNLGWMALKGLGEEVNIDKASEYFKNSFIKTNKYNISNVDEELIKESNKNLVKLNKNNFIAKFNLFYTEYLKLTNLFTSKINLEKEFITDISLIEQKLRVYEKKLISLEVNIYDLKIKVKNDQDLLIKLLILSLENNYIEFEKVINQSYINLNNINIVQEM